ncbi:hypothetical protein PFLUV_G00001150 [Perca fluviatilis]|uniref:Pyrin domain-containing protein n=1 Tax=Perca fluviatilis TaxID=8168 RepID=A0A6A5FLD2_PERFL|nr:hypothetical protein PFLUV_G00001150 [Perca fluviatilis]
MAHEVLLNALDELGEDEFQRFKWILKEERLKDSSTIPWSKLENAKTLDTVRLMIQTYTPPEAVELTNKVLKKINRNDLVQSSSASSSGTKGTPRLAFMVTLAARVENHPPFFVLPCNHLSQRGRGVGF